MSGFTQGVVTALIPALVVSIITAYVTVRLSLKQFYSERWWEKKAEAYSRIMEHLSSLQYCLREWFGESLHEKELTDDVKRQLNETYRQAEEAIRKTAGIGAYIVSDGTANALQELLREFQKKDPSGNWLRDMDRHQYAVTESMARIREYAKADLRKR